MDFTTLKNVSDKYNENNDCTVKCTAILLGTTYEDAWNLLADHGRKPRKGLPSVTYMLAMQTRGLKFNNVFHRPRVYNSHTGRRSYGNVEIDPKYARMRYCKTVRQLSSYLPRQGLFMIRTSGHVLAFKDGKVIDWTDGRSHRIVDIWEVSGEPVGNNPGATISSHSPAHRELAKPRRTRTTRACWEMVRLDNGERIRTFKRKPTKQIQNIRNGGYIPSLGKHVKLDIRPI